MTTTNTPRALVAYESKLAEVRQRIEDLGRALDRHSDRAAKTPRSWANHGDLGYVASELDDLLTFIGCQPSA